jgi:hypothetical protein
VSGSGKHSSLLQYDNNYCDKSFIVVAPEVLLELVLLIFLVVSDGHE